MNKLLLSVMIALCMSSALLGQPPRTRPVLEIVLIPGRPQTRLNGRVFASLDSGEPKVKERFAGRLVRRSESTRMSPHQVVIGFLGYILKEHLGAFGWAELSTGLLLAGLDWRSAITFLTLEGTLWASTRGNTTRFPWQWIMAQTPTGGRKSLCGTREHLPNKRCGFSSAAARACLATIDGTIACTGAAVVSVF